MRRRVRSVLRKFRTRKPGPLRVGVVGFYGHGNYGDELFFDVFRQYFGEFELINVVDLPKSPYLSRNIDDILDEVDVFLIGGGDLLRPWAVDRRYFNPRYLEKPVFVVGVGAATLWHKDYQAKDAAIAEYQRFFRHPNVKFIGVRDDESKAWVAERIAPTAPLKSAPDIVCALDLPLVHRPLDPPILGLVTRFRPDRETPDDYTMIKRLADEYIANGWRIRHLILGTDAVGKRDVANSSDLEIPGKELVYSDNLDDLTRAIGECSAFASMKFHGTVVATMYGIPSLVLIPTPKNRNFMRRLDRLDLMAKFDAADLVEKSAAFSRGHSDETIQWLRAGAQELLYEVRDRMASTLTQ